VFHVVKVFGIGKKLYLTKVLSFENKAKMKLLFFHFKREIVPGDYGDSDIVKKI